MQVQTEIRYNTNINYIAMLRLLEEAEATLAKLQFDPVRVSLSLPLSLSLSLYLSLSLSLSLPLSLSLSLSLSLKQGGKGVGSMGFINARSYPRNG